MTRSKKILNIATAIVVGLFLACTVASFAIRAKTQPKVETAQAWEYDFTLGQDYAQVLTVPRKAVLSETRSFFDEEGTEYTYEQYYVYVAASSLGLFGEVYDAERVNVNLFPIEAYAPEDYHPEIGGIYIHAGDERINVDPEDAAEYGWSPFTVPDDLVLVSAGSLNYWQKIITTELDRVEEGTRVRMMPEKPVKEEDVPVTLSASGGSPSSGKSDQSTEQNPRDSGETPDAGSGGGAGSARAEMPAATDSLTLYAYWFYDSAAKQAIDIFQRKYPDVKIDYQLLGEDEFADRLRTELPAGRGPDIVFGGEALLPDVYKAMATGIFMDYGPYMANDDEFDPADYYEGVLRGGRLFEKQYFLPLSFGMGVFMTTREALEENGIEPESLGTWDGFCAACRKYRENSPGSRLFNVGCDMNQYYMSDLFHSCGFRMIDYEKNEVSFDETRFREMVDLCRLYCTPTVPEDLQWGAGSIDLHDRKCLFINEMTSKTMLILNDAALLINWYGETPVLFCIPDPNGNVCVEPITYVATPEASQNKLNAWRFVKILLSEEVQGPTVGTDGSPSNAFSVGDPVRKDALRETVDAFLNSWYPQTAEVAAAYLDQADRIADAVLLPPVVRKYVMNSMSQYVTSEDGSNYDKLFAKLKS
ncbi:MAG: extracellular solute-binding protein, partial [Clostridiales bacterium]|nr:extracellular solute-binding protein [Clostridiales bacterium]